MLYGIFLGRKGEFGWLIQSRILEGKRLKTLKDTGFFQKKLDSKDERIPIEITKMYNHFENLNSTNVCSETCYLDLNVIDELNKAFTENEVTKCMKKIKNGRSAGLDNIYPEFIKYIPD